MTQQRSAFLYICSEEEASNTITKHIAELVDIPTNKKNLERISNKIHPQVRWLIPEKRTYKKQELEELLAETKQQQLKPLIFVITNAELLNEQAANSLLKVLEEPPHNIFFILTTLNIQKVLPTIRSRVLVFNNFQSLVKDEQHPLFLIFKSMPLPPFGSLNEILKKKDIDDIQSNYIFEELIAHWHEQEKNNAPHAKQILKILLYFAQKTPMPGSSKIFWRTLFLSISTSTRANPLK